MPVFPTPFPAYPFDYNSKPDEGKPHIQEVSLAGLNWQPDNTAVVNLASASWAEATRFAGGNAVAVANRPGLSMVQSMFVDNTGSITPVKITFPDTGFSVTIPQLTQQWFNVVTRLTIFQITLRSNATPPTVYACNVTVFPTSVSAPIPLITTRFIVFRTVVAGGIGVTTNDVDDTVFTSTLRGGGTYYDWTDNKGNSGTSLALASPLRYRFIKTPSIPISTRYSATGDGGTNSTGMRFVLQDVAFSTVASGAPGPVLFTVPAPDRPAGAFIDLIGNEEPHPPFFNSFANGNYACAIRIQAQYF